MLVFTIVLPRESYDETIL